MDIFRQWVLCIVIVAASGTFVYSISPRGATDKALRTVAGIFVVVTVCTPLAKLDKTDYFKNTFSDYNNISNSSDALEEELIEQCAKSLEERLEPVADKYSVLSFNVTMDAYLDECGSIIIQNIHLDTVSENSESAMRFRSEAQKILGVPLTS